jgi:hypothetical protein
MSTNTNFYTSSSLESNVEMIDIDPNDVTPNEAYPVCMSFTINRIPDEAFASFIYYAIGWTWVKDHAE